MNISAICRQVLETTCKWPSKYVKRWHVVRNKLKMMSDKEISPNFDAQRLERNFDSESLEVLLI